MLIQQKFSTSYVGYNNIEYSDICLAMCFFNPLNYKNNLNNIKTVITELKKTNIPFYIIELIYPGQSSSIPEANCVVKGKSFYFSKENLWNILETKIPDKYEKIVFLDSDVLFTDPDWLNKISDLLDKHKVVHAMDNIYRNIYTNNIYEKIILNNKNSKQSIVKAIKNNLSINLKGYHPGYNISIKRNFFHTIGGIFETYPVTAGDTLFWLSFVHEHNVFCGGLFCAPNLKEEKQKYLKYKNNILEHCNPQTEINYLSNNNCLHLYHGELKNRYYGKQLNFIPGPFILKKNEDGVIEIEIKHPDIKDLKHYFEARLEDS